MSTKAERAVAREQYCNDKLTPILQSMVAEMLKVLPEDPDEYMRIWLDAKIVEEGGSPPPCAAIEVAAPPPVSAGAPECRPSVGTQLEITGVILPEEESTRLSTLTQLIADTPAACRATMYTVRGSVIPEGAKVEENRLSEVQMIAVQNRMSTLTQMINDTPGASRGTLLTVRGSVQPSNLTPQEESRMSTLSAIITDTPGAARGTVVTVRGTLKSRPDEVVTCQVVVPEEEAKRLSSLSQLIAETPGAARATTVTVRGTVVTAAEAARMSTLSALVADTPGAARATLATLLSSAPKGDALEPLDSHESERKSTQKRVSNASQSEQLRQISEMEHAAHDAASERASNRKSAVSAYESGAKEAEQVASEGRKASSVKVDDAFKADLEKKRSSMGIQQD